MDVASISKSLNFEQHGKICGFILVSLSTIVSIASGAYITGLFLSSYPSTWLSYLYLAQGLVMCLITFIMKPLASKKPRLFSIITETSAIAIIILLFLASFSDIKWLPFFISVVFFLLSQVFIINVSNYTALLMSVREYKSNNRWFIAVSSSVGLVFGLTLPLLIEVWGLETAVYSFIFALALGVVIYLGTRPQVRQVKKGSTKQSAFEYPLFKALFLVGILIGTTKILIDFTFKSELAVGHNANQIAQYTSIVMSLSNVLAIFLQVFMLKKMQQYLGLVGIYLILPTVMVFTSLLYFFSSNLSTSIILIGLATAFQYSTSSTARDQALNVLPQQIRVSAKFIEKGIAKPSGNVLASILTFVIGNYLGMSMAGIIIMVASVMLILIILKVGKHYRSTLADALTLRRFDNMQFDESNFTDKQYRSFIDSSLKSDNLDLQLLGIKLTSKVKYQHLPENLTALLESDNADIKSSAVKAISEIKNDEVEPLLCEQFEKEQDIRLKCQLLNTIEAANPDTASAKATPLLSSDNPMLRATAISIALRTGDLQTCLIATQTLNDMVNSSDEFDRAFASRSLERMQIGNLTSILKQLIADSSSKASNNAIISAVSTLNTQVIPDIIKQLTREKVRYSAVNALIRYDSLAVPYISQAFMQGNLYLQKSLVKVLARIKHDSAEKQLVACVDHQSIPVMNILARYSAYRSGSMQVSEKFIEFAITMLEHEVKLIKVLSAIQNNNWAEFQQIEINSRIKQSKIRFLYWLAVANDPAMIKAIPTLIANIAQPSSAVFDNAIELIETYIKRGAHVNYLLEVFESKPGDQPGENYEDHKDMLDPWLLQVLQLTKDVNPEHGLQMDDMDKMMVLRRSMLFRELNAESLLPIAEIAQVQTVSKGTVIYSAGDSADAIYIIASGDIKLTSNNSPLLTLSGRGFFGVISLLEGAQLAATATALSDATLLYIDKASFDKILNELPEVSKAMTQLILSYLKDKTSGAVSTDAK